MDLKFTRCAMPAQLVDSRDYTHAVEVSATDEVATESQIRGSINLFPATVLRPFGRFGSGAGTWERCGDMIPIPRLFS